MLKQENQSEPKMKGSGGVKRGRRLPDRHWRLPSCLRVFVGPTNGAQVGKQAASEYHRTASLTLKNRTPLRVLVTRKCLKHKMC